MAELVFNIDGESAAYTFPDEAPVMEMVRAFNARYGSPATPDEDQVMEVLYWLANQLYIVAKDSFIEQERSKLFVEAESKYEFRRPTDRKGSDAGEPGDLAESAARGPGDHSPGADAGGASPTAD